MSQTPETIGHAFERGRDRGYRVPTDRDRSGGDRDRSGRTVIINNIWLTGVVFIKKKNERKKIETTVVPRVYARR